MIVHFVDFKGKESVINTLKVNEDISMDPGSVFTYKNKKYEVKRVTDRLSDWNSYEIFIDVELVTV